MVLGITQNVEIRAPTRCWKVDGIESDWRNFSLQTDMRLMYTDVPFCPGFCTGKRGSFSAQYINLRGTMLGVLIKAFTSVGRQMVIMQSLDGEGCGVNTQKVSGEVQAFDRLMCCRCHCCLQFYGTVLISNALRNL